MCLKGDLTGKMAMFEAELFHKKIETFSADVIRALLPN